MLLSSTDAKQIRMHLCTGFNMNKVFSNLDFQTYKNILKENRKSENSNNSFSMYF